MLTPLVAIRCITYNQEKYIKETLEGFVMQKTNFPFVAIVHDDASTDNTVKIIREYAEKFPDIIKPIFETENQFQIGGFKRISSIMNEALLNTKAKYIAICEGDDYWSDPLKLQKQVDFMESHPDYSLHFHNAYFFNEPLNKIIGSFDKYKENKIVPIEDLIVGGGGFCPSCSLFYKANLANKIPNFCKKYHVGDYPLQLFLATQGKVFYSKEIMSVYRVATPGSWTMNVSENPSLILQYQRLLRSLNFLKDFNNYMNGKYSDYFKKRINSDCCETILRFGIRKKLNMVKPRNIREKINYIIILLGLFKIKKKIRSFHKIYNFLSLF